MAQSTTLTSAGDYNLSQVELISYRIHGDEKKPYRIDLKPITLAIELTEDLFQQTMVGTVTVYDTQDIRTVLPITGLEKLNLKFNTPGLTGVNAVEGEGHPFQVYKIDQVRTDPQNPRGQVYQIFFTSQEAYFDSISRVSRAYEGTIEDMVENLLREKRYLNSKKPFIFEPTRSNTKYVVPNLRPFEVITKLCKKARPQKYNSLGYFFYETPKGFFFRSLESMFAVAGVKARPVLYKYNYQVSSVRSGETRDVQADMRNVIKYNFKKPVNTLFNMREGMYANQKTTYDPFYKTITETGFDYAKSFGDFFHTEHDGDGNKTTDKTTLPFSMFEDTMKDLSQHLLSKLYVSVESSKLFDNIEDTNLRGDFQTLMSQMLQMTQIRLDLMVNGNSLLQAGDMITFDIPLMRPLGDDKQEMSPYYSGRYLITGIKHTISVKDGQYHMILKCMKDAVRNRFPVETETYEINKPEKSLNSLYDLDNTILNDETLNT